MAHKRKILEALPMIGPGLAIELMDKFGSLEKIFSASEEDLLSVKGIGKGRVKKIKDILKEEKATYNIL